MHKMWAWIKRNRSAVALLVAAAPLSAPASAYVVKALPGLLPAKWWDPSLTPPTICFLVFSLAFRLIAEAYTLFGKHVIPKVRRGDFPRYFRALGMFWPKRVQLEVWDPAFEDEFARYCELKPQSDLRVLNLCFCWRMFWVILPTLYICITDLHLVFFSRKKRD